MQKIIKNHKLSLGIASVLAIVALTTVLVFMPSPAEAVPAAMVKQIDSYISPGGPWCGYQRYFCEGTVVTSPLFYNGTHRVTTWLNQCGGEEF
ncbi:MAG: hypothetical protein V3T72_13350 [Thermoanaerobaculia bacterium]